MGNIPFRFGRAVVAIAVLAIAAGVLVVADWVTTPGAGLPWVVRDGVGRTIVRSRPGGRVARHEYDQAGRLIRVAYGRRGGITGWRYPGGEVRLAYDAAGNRTAMTDATGTTRYAYDALGRPSEISSPQGKTLAYTYDPWGQLHRTTHPDGAAVEYTRDILGRVTRVSTPQGEIRYESRPSSRSVVRFLPNGVETRYQRDRSGRLASIVHAHRSRLVAAFEYEYGADGRVRNATQRSPRGSSRTEYRYDLLGRLVQVTDQDAGTTFYAYDAIGNRTSERGPRGTMTYDYDAAGRLTRAGEMRFTYDGDGNVIRREGGGATVVYTYDSEGRLTEVDDGDHSVQYVCDGDGILVARETGGSVARFLHHRVSALPQVAADLDGEGNVGTQYIFGTSRVGASDAGRRAVYLLEDHLGSTRCVVDDRGNVLARYEYSPFGVPKLVEGRDSTRFLFAGEEWDALTGLIYLRARHYDPELGRFLGADPADGDPFDPQSFNSYAYAGNDPVNRTDPTGLRPGWLPPPPPPPPPPFYDDARWWKPPPYVWMRRDTYHVDPRYNNLQTHHWTWYLPGHMLENGGIFGARTDWDHGARATIFLTAFHPKLWAVAAGLGLHDAASAWQSSGVAEAWKEIGLEAVFRFAEQSNWNAVKALEPWSSGVTVFSEIAQTQTARELFGAGIRAYREGRRHRDVLDHAGSVDPFVARLLDDTRNIFLPPPGGGGGGAFPLVGGVYLDQTAKLIGELGALTGAMYDSGTGRLILVGDKRTSLPPMKAEYLAAALRAVFTGSADEPGMTIDPHPDNPHAPVMLVVFFGNTANTRLGWVMFEADRVMKGYSVGRDNLTRQPVRSNVTGYRSLTSMALADPYGETNLWSRFWLVPEPVTARVSSEGTTILFDPVKMRVRTETMRWDGGRLVPAGGIRHRHAGAFADHFTRNYDRYAGEQSVYGELKQVAAAVALAKWMREQKVPVDWGAMRILGGPPHATPETTPAAFAEETKNWTDGLVTRTLRIHSFGGVEMTPKLAPRTTPQADEVRDALLAGWTAARHADQDVFTVTANGIALQALALPGVTQREIGSYQAATGDVAAEGCLDRIPGTVRAYDSLHNESSEFGYSWTLQMPRLDFEPAGGEEASSYLTVEGDPSTRVLVQRFVLTNAFGIGQVRFEAPFIDHNLRRIGFKAKDTTLYRAIYPEGELYRLLFQDDDRQVLFAADGRLVAIVTATERVIYSYDAARRLAAIQCSDQPVVAYAWDANGRLASMSGPEDAAFYEYDRAGNLARVRTRRGTTVYRYDERRLLVSVEIDGEEVVANRYDLRGRLHEQKSGDGTTTRRSVAQAKDGGRVITIVQNGRTRREHYDASLRLIRSEEPSGATLTWTHEPGGVTITAALPNGGTARIERDVRGRPRAIEDPRGVRAEVRYSDAGRPAEIRINGRRWATRRYDANGRLGEVAWEGGWRERFRWDDAGRLLAYAREGPRMSDDALQFTYGADGRVASLESRATGAVVRNAEPARPEPSPDRTVRVPTASGAAMVYRYDDAGRLIAVEDPYQARTTFTRDDRGRVTHVRLPGGYCREYLFDAVGPTGWRMCGG